jgi:hypothetical protein
MRKGPFILSILMMLALCAAPEAFGQKKQRVNFRRGATEKIIGGKLKNYDDRKVYLIKVRRGQTLDTEQIKSDASTHYVTVEIAGPAGADVSDSDASCNDRKKIAPTAAGDYRITVYECRKADAWRGAFKLRVSVR